MTPSSSAAGACHLFTIYNALSAHQELEVGQAEAGRALQVRHQAAHATNPHGLGFDGSSAHQELEVGQTEAGGALQVRHQAARRGDHDVRAAVAAAAAGFRIRFAFQIRHQR